MELIVNELDSTITIPKKIKNSLKNNSFCFFDIETTGFSRHKDKVILIGLLYPTKTGSKIVQLFANDLKDEYELLIKFIGFISKFDTLISFNGDIFDIPFLNKRFKFNNLNYTINTDNNIDLLKVVKKNQRLLELDNCKLKSVEKKLSIYRNDTISGKESVDLYYKYINNKDENLKSTILKHNYDDIFYLPKVLKIYDLIEEMSNIDISISFCDNVINFNIDIRDIKFEGEMLLIKGKTNKLNITNQIFYKDNYTFEWSPTKGSFKLAISLKAGKLSTGKSCLYLDQSIYNFPLYLIDKSNYKLPKEYILIEENKKLIHENIKQVFDVFIQNIFNELHQIY